MIYVFSLFFRICMGMFIFRDGYDMICIYSLPLFFIFLFVWECSYFEMDLGLEAMYPIIIIIYYALQRGYNNLVTLACGKGPGSLFLCLFVFYYCDYCGGTSYEIGHLKV